MWKTPGRLVCLAVACRLAIAAMVAAGEAEPEERRTVSGG